MAVLMKTGPPEPSAACAAPHHLPPWPSNRLCRQESRKIPE